MEITLSQETKIDIHATVRYRDMDQLFSVCKWGLPENISVEMRESLQSLVCLCLNPYRSMWSGKEGKSRKTGGEKYEI